MAELLVGLLLDVVLHLVCDEPVGDLVADRGEQADVVAIELLLLLLVGDLDAPDGVVAELDRADQAVARDRMHLLTEGRVLAELCLVGRVSAVRDVRRLSSVEHRRE